MFSHRSSRCGNICYLENVHIDSYFYIKMLKIPKFATKIKLIAIKLSSTPTRRTPNDTCKSSQKQKGNLKFLLNQLILNQRNGFCIGLTA